MHKAKPALRWAMGGVAGCAALYVVSYAILSLTGGWVVSESGERRIMGFVASSDILLWQPRYGYAQRFVHADGERGFRVWGRLGHFYAPLILLDQAYVHPTIHYIGPDGSMIDSFPPYEDYHPLQRNRFHGRFPYKEDEIEK